jgi:CBS domain-containing protein
MADLQTMPPRVETVSDLMTEWVVTIQPSESLLEARDKMTQSKVSQLVVLDEKSRPIGLLSKRDIARFVLEDVTTRSLEDISVSEAASNSVPTFRPDLPVFNAARLFDTENFTFAVVAGDQPLSGVVTETDLCQYYSRKVAGKYRVLDFMSRDFIFAKSTYPVLHVAHAIVFRQSCVPIIDKDLVGILTLSDLLAIRERAPGMSHGRFSIKSSLENDIALITAKDLMTRDPVTTYQDTDLAQAAQLMIRKGISSLPVIDTKSNVVGLLTKHDIVRALGRIGTNFGTES